MYAARFSLSSLHKKLKKNGQLAGWSMTGDRQMGRRGHKILFVGRVMAGLYRAFLSISPRSFLLGKATRNRHCFILFIAFVNLVSARNPFQLFNLRKLYIARYYSWFRFLISLKFAIVFFRIIFYIYLSNHLFTYWII